MITSRTAHFLSDIHKVFVCRELNKKNEYSFSSRKNVWRAASALSSWMIKTTASDINNTKMERSGAKVLYTQHSNCQMLNTSSAPHPYSCRQLCWVFWFYLFFPPIIQIHKIKFAVDCYKNSRFYLLKKKLSSSIAGQSESPKSKQQRPFFLFPVFIIGMWCRELDWDE